MAGGFSVSSLNAAQREAVHSLDGPVLILAGAGTGKTRTVTCRIAAFLDHGVDPAKVLALTFTNKAANEMRERIGGMVTRKAAKAMTVSTFHSLCVRLLRFGIDRLGYKKNFSICSGSDQTGLMKQIIVRKGGAREKIKPEEVLSAISRAKNASGDIAAIDDDFFALLALEYTNELRARNAVDFDDLLLLGDRLLSEHREVREHFRQRYERVTVDEFQDTNSLQMRILKQLVGPPYHVCVVGDDDQSIYGWRGADVSNILDFESHFPNPKVIRLEENYRSTEAVLHTANSLIRHNAGRHEKVLRATTAGGAPVRIVAMPGEAEEAEFIAEEICELRAASKRPWEDFAVLFRTNKQSRKLEEGMRERKIPYRVVGAQSFFDRREVRDVLAYAQLLSNPDADVALLRILNTPNRGIGQATAVLATDRSRENETSVWEALHDETFLGDVSAKAANSARRFTEQVRMARLEIQHGANPGIVLRRLLDECEYVAWLQRGCKTDSEKSDRAENVSEVLAELEKTCRKGKSIQEFVDNCTLAGDRDDDDIEKKDGVTLITLHASKGLEFSVVYLVGLEEGVLPHKRSIDTGTCDEERRLLYVGITRARERLSLTYCSTRVKWGKIESCLPSSFLKELDETHLEETSYDDIMGAEVGDEELRDMFGSFMDTLDDEPETL